MPEIELLTKSPQIFKAARVEFIFPRKFRLQLSGAFLLLTMVFGGAYGILFMVPKFSELLGVETPPGTHAKLLGLLLLFASFFWVLKLLDFYFLASARPVALLRRAAKEDDKIYYLDFGGARRMLYLKALGRESVNFGKIYSFFGKTSNFILQLAVRLGIDFVELLDFIENSRDKVIEVPRETFLGSLADIAESTGSDTIGAKEFMILLFDLDKDFEKFLFERELRKKELIGASDWVAESLEGDRKNSRWWEKSALGNIPGIGKDLGFGYTFNLDRYSGEITSFGSKKLHFWAHSKEISAIEESLSRSGQTNLVMVGEPGTGKHTILKGLSERIFKGIAPPALEHKRMIILDTAAVTAGTKTKGAFEGLMIRMMNEAVSAGNIILIIDNFPEFLESSLSMGVDVITLLEPYLSSAGIQVIALADSDTYHRIMEPNGKLIRLFEKIDIAEPSIEETIKILRDISPSLEARSRVILTYRGLAAVADLANRYITQGMMPEKAVDLLDSAIVLAAQSGKQFLNPTEVEAVIEKEFKVPISKAGKDESEKLLNMENILHESIVNQEEAIKAVANALRKVRSGLHEGKRPVGTFLFLGPTGVGKTETAKALAKVYFGKEDAMTRFDMSEFQGPEGINKLIGSFGGREQGVLSVALRQKPFGLLLFDEFEKSSKEVVNLFLQILEEGFFTDAFGKKVSARESMIIATSNAGSNLIWELLQKGVDPVSIQKEVIDSIRQQGVFSPEILNRFDAIVVYHPLNKEQLKKVAQILLKDLARRLKEKDIDFEITDELAEKVVDIGYDPVMGARPMRRAIADRVEQLIARKLLEGKLERGSSIKLTPEDLNTI